MDGDGRSRTWRESYRADTDDLVRGRLSWCTAMAVLGVVFTLLQISVEGNVAVGARLAIAFGYGSVSLATFLLARLPRFRGHAVRLAGIYGFVLVVVLTINFSLLPGDTAAAAAAIVAVTMGTALLLPWGPRYQAAVAIESLAAYAYLVFGGRIPVNAATAGLVASAAVVASGGALLVERYRMTSLERAWQQEQLVALARALAGRVEPERLAATVVEHGMRLLASDSAGLSLYDPSRRVYRVVNMSGVPSSERDAMVGLEVPEDYPLLHQILAAGTFFEWPGDDPDNPFLRPLAERGVGALLYIVIRLDDEVLGILTFARLRAEAFGQAERLVGRGLADQTALAMRTVRLVADLRRANELKSEFVSTMSHELRTPLNVILGFAEMSRDPEVSAAERALCLERIHSAGTDLLGLIESTLEIGRIEAGRDEVRLEPVSLPELWATLGESCAQMPRKHSVELQWSRIVPDARLMTDRRKLTVLVRNLVGNALKFTEEGFVHVEVSVEDGDAVLVVADSGIGIPAEEQEKVFEIFRQSDSSDSRRYGGTGLGLYIVRRFVTQLGGTITLESRPGRGSVFSVRLPDTVRPVGLAAIA